MYSNDFIFNSQQQLLMLIFYIFGFFYLSFFLSSFVTRFYLSHCFGSIALYSTVVIHSNILMLICSKFCSNTSEINQFQIINYSFFLTHSLTYSLSRSLSAFSFCSVAVAFHIISFLLTFLYAELS